MKITILILLLLPRILCRVPQALEIMENLENQEKKVSCIEKSWNLKKTE